jgi:hypothetical protein
VVEGPKSVPPASFQSLCLAALPRWAFLVDLAIAIKVCVDACILYIYRCIVF